VLSANLSVIFYTVYFLLNVAADMSLERQNMADGSELYVKNGSSCIVSH